MHVLPIYSASTWNKFALILCRVCNECVWWMSLISLLSFIRCACVDILAFDLNGQILLEETKIDNYKLVFYPQLVMSSLLPSFLTPILPFLFVFQRFEGIEFLWQKKDWLLQIIFNNESNTTTIIIIIFKRKPQIKHVHIIVCMRLTCQELKLENVHVLYMYNMFMYVLVFMCMCECVIMYMQISLSCSFISKYMYTCTCSHSVCSFSC